MLKQNIYCQNEMNYEVWFISVVFMYVIKISAKFTNVCEWNSRQLTVNDKLNESFYLEYSPLAWFLSCMYMYIAQLNSYLLSRFERKFILLYISCNVKSSEINHF